MKAPTPAQSLAISAAMAELPPAMLDQMLDALQTALDDSEEWEKYSDEDDDRREHEQIALNRLVRFIRYAKVINDERTGNQ